MSKELVYYRDCGETHIPDCQLLHRIQLKEKLCQKYNIKGHIVPEWIEVKIDNLLNQGE